MKKTRKPARKVIELYQYGVYKRRAATRKISFDLSFRFFVALIRSSCFYCKEKPYNWVKKGSRKARLNGVDRMDNRFGYIPGNVVPACKFCNNAKASLTREEFIYRCSLVAKWVNLH